MDRREAIDILVGVVETHSEEENEALDLAIEALRESTDKHTNATTNLYDSRLAKDLLGISEEAKKLRMFEGDAESCKEKKSKLESVEKATSEDAESTMGQPKSKLESDVISRQAAIEAVNKLENEVADYVEPQYTQGFETCIGAAIGALALLPPVEPKPVCEDAISRADTIKAMCSKCVINRECVGECSDVVVIKNMPNRNGGKQ